METETGKVMRQRNTMAISLLRVLAASIIVLVAATAAVAGDIEDCKNVKTLVKTNPAKAVSACRRVAEKGQAWAQYNLGVMYDLGEGVQQDYREAANWYRKAAEQGLPSAQANLGSMYADGLGVIQDYKQAMKWYQKAADQGFAGAQYNLGVMYERGEGVPLDNQTAMKWYRMAAEQGYSDAKARLAALGRSSGRDGPKVPTLEEALSAPAIDLAKSYESGKLLLSSLQLAEGGASIVTREGTITRENVDEFRSVFGQRLAIYETAIKKRGYKKIAGRYRAEATSSCARVGSFWISVIGDKNFASPYISQDGFEIQIIEKHKLEDQMGTIEMPGVVVESVLTFSDAINADFIFLGEIGAGSIKIRPDTDAVLASWPSWAGPPSRSDLAACTVTLFPVSR